MLRSFYLFIGFRGSSGVIIAAFGVCENQRFFLLCAGRQGLTEQSPDCVYNTGGKILFCRIYNGLGDVGGGGSLSLTAIREGSWKLVSRGHAGRLAGGPFGGGILGCPLGGWIKRRGGLFGPLAGRGTEGRVKNWGLYGGSHGKRSSCGIGVQVPLFKQTPHWSLTVMSCPS
jgi:hypothetical protein